MNREAHHDWASGRELTPCPRLAPIAMIWPVWGFGNPIAPVVAHFFDYDAAVDFVTAELPRRNLYIGNPKYDRRKAVWTRRSA